MDLEEITRGLFREGRSRSEILEFLQRTGLSEEFAGALFLEIKNSEELSGVEDRIRDLIIFHPTGLEAGSSGLGSRGEGDFIIHHGIARISSEGISPPSDSWTDSAGRSGQAVTALVTPEHQDDGGVVRIPAGELLVVSVDGLHSRLGHFPFLAGFHVARACLRDVLVMGAQPAALFSDVHVATNADPAIILDYTAGISAVGELAGVPLIAGSTLRIAGDLVLGDRLSGAAGAVGVATTTTPRIAALPGDVMIMTSGSGGGTIAAAAVFHGKAEVVRETLNLDFIRFTKQFLDSPLVQEVHSLTDVTNGGIRGDLQEIARTAELDVVLYTDRFLGLIHSRVLTMLQELDIDPLGVSVDSLLVIAPPGIENEILSFMEGHGMKGDVIGVLEPGTGKVFSETSPSSQGGINNGSGSCREEMRPRFRESPYTPIKVVADKEKVDPVVVKKRIDEAVSRAMEKKRWIVSQIRDG